MATRPTRKSLLSTLIQTAYLPEELPPTITARHFAKYCKDEFANLTRAPRDAAYPTQFERFSIPRENGTRRDLSLVHPGAQLRLSLILTKNHVEIRRRIDDAKISLYSTEPDINNFRAFKGITFTGLDIKRSRIATKRKFILCADISRFFYTIYTHSIPWAVLGKEKVKTTYMAAKVKRTKKHWTDELDRALQACQSRETFGIPVGPDTSRIVAELLLSGVHSEAEFVKATKECDGFRLVDDFFLGFDSEPQCQTALTSLRNALAQFNLQLNDDKTFIKSSKEIFTERWRYELINSPITRGSAQTQARQIRKTSELALYHANNIGNAHPIKWLAQKLIRTKFERENFLPILNILLRFARDFPICINLVAIFIINNKRRCKRNNTMKIIEAWVKSVFSTHAQHSHDFEVAWALVVCGALKIKVSKSHFGNYTDSMCSVVFALLGLLNENDLLIEPFNQFGWRAQVKKSGINGDHWLMYYESVLRGWTKDREMADAVKTHPHFGDLLKHKISFLDDSAFGDVEINLERRRLIKIAPEPAAAQDEQAGISDNEPEEIEVVPFDFSDAYDSFGIASL